ncbi:MAG: CHAT domain-containing protein [Calothrix sp. MO_192.B10]|nr:CHAT domain-containing protein [Calothrix sp. MO_192.B10]
MARKWRSFFRRIQSFLNLKKFSLDSFISRFDRRKIRKNIAYYLLLFTVLFTIIGFLPVVAQNIPSKLVLQTSVSPIQLVQEGKDFYSKGNYNEAIKKLQEAKSVFRARGDKLNLSMTLSNLSLAYQQLGIWDKAEYEITESIKLLHQNDDKSTKEELNLFAQAKLVQGQLEQAKGNPAGALSAWNKATTIFTKLGDNTGINRSRVYESLALQELGLYREAYNKLIPQIKPYHKLITLIKELENQPDSNDKAITFRAFGNILRIVGNTDRLTVNGKKIDYLKQSQQYLQASLKISQNLNSYQDIAEAFLSLGNTARAAYKRAQNTYELTPITGEKKTAEEKIKDALKCYKKLIYEDSAPPVQKNKVVYLQDEADRILCKELFPNGHRYSLIQQRQKIQAELNNLSLLIDYEEWVKRIQDKKYKDISSTRWEIPSTEWEKPLMKTQIENLPSLQYRIENLLSNRAKVYAQINLAKSLMKLSNMREKTSLVYHKVGKLEDNRLLSFYNIEQILYKAAEQAKKLKDKRAQSNALGYLGRYLYEISEQLPNNEKLTKNKLLQDSYNRTKQAILLAEEIDEKGQNFTKVKYTKDLVYQWEWQLGRVLRKQGRLNKNPQKMQQAIAAYEAAIDNLESVRNDLTSFNNLDLKFSFRDTIEPIFRELVDLLLPYDPNTEVRESNSSTQESLQQIGETQEALQKAQKVIEDLQVAELENFLRCRLTNTQSVPIYQIIDEENSNTAVLYSIILENRLEVILKLPKNLAPKKQFIRYTTLVSKNDVENTAKSFLNEIKQGLSAQEKGCKLYQWLLKQADENELKNRNIKTLVFVLDGALRNIPIAALYDGKNYIVKNYSIALSPGIQLTKQQPLKKEKFKVLAAGASNFKDPKIDDLSHVNKELKKIENALPKKQVNIIKGNFTTEDLQKQTNSQSFDVIHLATHGQFSSIPDQTFIHAYNRPFYLNEIKELLRSREENRPDAIKLLVLSACQTATGDTRAVLGIAGVSIEAGSGAAIASLLDVNDAYTSELMSHFYKELAKPGITKAKALRLAQEALLNQADESNEYKRPRSWAPFILVGNWR